MTALQKINLGTPPTAVDGDTVRTANTKTNANVDVLNTQATLTSSSPNAVRDLVSTDMGKRVNFTPTAASTVHFPPANTLGADQIVSVHNLSVSNDITMAVAPGSSDAAPGVVAIKPNELVTYETDGQSLWRVIGRKKGVNEAVQGALAVAGVATLASLSVTGAAGFASRPLFGINTPWDGGNLIAPLTAADNLAGVASKATARTNLGVGRTLIKTVTLNAAAGLVLSGADIGNFDSITVQCVGVAFSTAGGELRFQMAPNADGSGGGYGAYHSMLGFTYNNTDGSHGTADVLSKALTYGRLVYPPSGASPIGNATAEFTFSNMQGLSGLGPQHFGRCYCFETNGSMLNGTFSGFLQAAVGVVKYISLFASSGTVSGKFIVYGNNS
jgi:hypothetical protein